MLDKLFKTDSKKTLIADDTSSESQDVRKYTGMSKDKLSNWASDRPGVAGNQAAGSITAGNTTGLGGMMAGEGYGGWGPDSNGPLKFPPTGKAEAATSGSESNN